MKGHWLKIFVCLHYAYSFNFVFWGQLSIFHHHEAAFVNDPGNLPGNRTALRLGGRNTNKPEKMWIPGESEWPLQTEDTEVGLIW